MKIVRERMKDNQIFHKYDLQNCGTRSRSIKNYKVSKFLKTQPMVNFHYFIVITMSATTRLKPK